MPENINPHKDHRERVRREFLENGFSDATPPHKIFELLLFYSIPRKDTNEIAHELLNRFGSVEGVLNASAHELMRVNGVGENTAALIKLLVPIFKRYQSSDRKTFKPRSYDEMCDFVKKKYMGITRETFAISTFNHTGKLIAFDVLSEGDVSSVAMSNRSVVEKALERKAAAVIISHNHPTGHALPSPSDVKRTEELFAAFKHLEIQLLDHIIVSNEDDDLISMAQTEKYDYIFN
ncbi:MAG: RadC family protein [Clostridia bacterium]|nr:RadC family protein [Clostridia bacterium]